MRPASGDYPQVADDIVGDLGTILVTACRVGAGDRVLDVGAGSGNAAIQAARVRARVVASDLTPALLEAGQAKAVAEGLDLTWDEGDAEALPYADGSFDVVLSNLGVMAPLRPRRWRHGMGVPAAHRPPSRLSTAAAAAASWIATPTDL
jgi:SAM-dependent methyltransferase